MDDGTKKKAKRWFGIACVSAMVCYAIFAVVFVSGSDKETVCKGVEVVIKDSADRQFITRGDIIRALNDYEMMPGGVSMKNINTTQMERKIHKIMPTIKEICCYKTPESTIRVDITQRTPVVRIMNGTSSYYVDTDGKKMPSTPGHPAYVMIATGRIDEKLALGKLYEFGKYVNEDKFWNSQIEQVDFDYSGNATLSTRVGLQNIKMGTLDNYEQKLENLMTLYKKAFNKGGWNKYKEINLKYDNQVVCTRKQ